MNELLLASAIEKLVDASNGKASCYDVNIDAFEGDRESLLRTCADMLQEEHIALLFPGEYDFIHWNIQDFIEQAAECDSIERGSLVTLRTRNTAIQLVNSVSEIAHGIIHQETEATVITPEGIVVKMVARSIPVAAYASKTGAYEDDILGAATGYHAVVVNFSDYKGIRTEGTESAIVDAYLFELASKHGAVFVRSDFDYDASEPWWVSEPIEVNLVSLEVANEAIRLFLSAAQVHDASLRFLSFYKVIEHVAPLMSTFFTHATMLSRIDSLNGERPSPDALHELIAIARKHDPLRKELELIKLVLDHGVDLIELNQLVPNSFRRPLSLSSSPQERQSVISDLAGRIYSTRNQIAHAKANYEAKGNECQIDDLPAFAVFLEKSAADLIRWYNRGQPDTVPSKQR